MQHRLSLLYEPGEIVLRGGDELFHHPAVVGFYRHIITEWRPETRDVALYFGCSPRKPFSTSFIHLKTRRMLETEGMQNKIQQFILSEPLIICPRELESLFPAANYDFPPTRLSHKGELLFVRRLRKFLRLRGHLYKHHVVFAPNHYRDIFLAACRDLIQPTIVPYNLYTLKTLRSTLSSIMP